jgi:hypothetical protein
MEYFLFNLHPILSNLPTPKTTHDADTGYSIFLPFTTFEYVGYDKNSNFYIRIKMLSSWYISETKFHKIITLCNEQV